MVVLLTGSCERLSNITCTLYTAKRVWFDQTDDVHGVDEIVEGTLLYENFLVRCRLHISNCILTNYLIICASLLLIDAESELKFESRNEEASNPAVSVQKGQGETALIIKIVFISSNLIT